MGGILDKLFHGENGQPRTVELKSHRVQVQKKLGEGGFATVFLVKDCQSGKPFALKRFECLNDPARRKLAETEIKILKLFSKRSDSIIALVDTDDEQFVLLPFYSGGSLQSVVDKERNARNIPPYEVVAGCFEKQEILQILLDMCDALALFHTHSTPLAHRDVAPGNVLLTKMGVSGTRRGVLMDFGSVAPARCDTTSYAKCVQIQEHAESTCSILYRAPELYEVVTDSVVDERTDVWSVGCVLYFMVYGVSPFEYALQEGGSMKLAVLGGSVRFHDSVQCDEDLRSLITQMLVLNPAERPHLDVIKTRVESMISSHNSS